MLRIEPYSQINRERAKGEKLSDFAFTLVGSVNLSFPIFLIYILNSVDELLETLGGFLSFF